MKMFDTLTEYSTIPYNGIEYATCREFDHISRYRTLRQVAHNPAQDDRFVTLETVNPYTSNLTVQYYRVPSHLENRLDIIARDFLGSASYAWVIARFNEIEDGYTVHEGQTLKIPKSVTDLFNKHELLAAVNPYSLNLGSE